MTRLLAIFLLLFALPAAANDLSNATWSETDASNTSAVPNGWPSGMQPNQVEPVARGMMGAIKRFYNHAGPTLTSGGTANVQTLTYSVAPAAYVQGDTYTFIVGAANTGSATLNVNGLGAKTIKYAGASLVGSELQAGTIVVVAYDGTNLQLVGTSGTIQQSMGGTGDNGSAWTSYTPSVSCVAGTLTTSSAVGAYKPLGKTIFVRWKATLTTVGTCASGLLFSLPATAAGDASVGARENALTGAAMPAAITSGSANMTITKYDGTFAPANGWVIAGSAVFESQ